MSIISTWLQTEIVTSLGHQFAADRVIGTCIENERYALLEFKAGFLDSDVHLSTWRAQDDCCKWRGVECNNQTGHVTKLDLRYFDASLRGEISPSLLNLSYLSHLDLGHRDYGRQPIPNFIGSLTKLRYLDLSYSTFDGNIPKFIGSLTELRYLNLSYNSLKGTIPKVIGSLTKLRYLDLSRNFVHGTVPYELGNLTNLRYLNLANAGSVKNLDWLSNLALLQRLDMRETPFTEPNHWVDMILRLPKLSYLLLSNCNLSQVTLPYSSFVNSSVSIANLDVSDNNLTSSAYQWLLPLTSNRLLHLDLSGNRLDGIPKYFGNLCSLTSLVMKVNRMVASFPGLLTNLSGCTPITLEELDVYYSRFTGPVPSRIQDFVSLKSLVLANNQLNGTISSKVWELPKLEYLSASSNYLRGVIPEEFGKSKLRYIDLSKNALEGVLSEVHMLDLSNLEHLDLSLNSLSFQLSTHWIPPFQLDHIDLSSCKLGPHFPNWIQTQKNLSYLNIANSSISDTVPMGFWDGWPSQLRYLNLSFNNISGEVGDLSSKLVRYSAIDLSSNNFYGLIPKVPSDLVSLNLSRNKFYGGISFLCQIVDGILSFLDLSRNSLNGQIPDCLSHFKELIILNLAHNNLSGTIPTSVGSLVQLEVLYLCNNNFSGELPLLLKNCTKLNFLCLRGNRFSGHVPTWIGENLSELYGLSLRSNNFFGPIPSQICQLANLQILDLSKNKLNGTIPSCLNNLTAMVEEGLSLEQTLHYYSPAYTSVGPDGRLGGDDYSNYVDYVMIEWQGNEREFKSINLGLLKSIDLSSNNLVGKIPDELTDLYEILALNLSGNSLRGEIPQKIGELKSLLVLDLSRNNFSGRIPLSMSAMSSISYLDVSNNKLSGRIPSSTQLQSFDASRYAENAGLCGPPVTRNCPGDETHEFPNVGFEDGVDEEDMDESSRWFYIGGSAGFVIGFWIACGALLLNRRGRHAFFRMHAHTMDWIYLRMLLIRANLRIVATGT
ncbi:receptor-like protein EIX1 [Cynara cardunculus var. scolymus]|uniref:receptor-like protein EIX1 n=1 Tax=Cynara cardunculus var. scolymus TaxID=59895 RepID=UPI000D62E263|nr:receptor-like protein EIX1 [Cynara cardunculus var. scolymus]